MKINSSNIISNSPRKTPTFGSFPICRGVVMRSIKDGSKIPVPVELHLLRAEDIAELRQMQPKWEKTTILGKSIINTFLKFANTPTTYSKNLYGANFFALKPVNASVFGSNEPIALAMLTRVTNRVSSKMHATLNFIQTASEFVSAKENRQFSGCGEMMLYGLSKFLKSINANTLSINSLPKSTGFYQKLFEAPPTGFSERIFKLQPQHIDNLIVKTEEKYNLPKGIEIPEATLNEISENSYLAVC